MITEEQKEKLAEDLIGTSGVYDGVLAEEYGVDVGDLGELVSDYAGRCQHCGWWVEVDELDEEEHCEDCQ